MIIKALKNGDRELAVKLISNAQPYQTCLYDDEGQTALHIAIQKNYIDIVQKLLEKGANINALASDDCYGYMTPLHYAALTGNLHLSKLLLNWGANRNIENKRNMTASTLAYQHGHIEIARLIERGEKAQSYRWPVNVPDKNFVEFNSGSADKAKSPFLVAITKKDKHKLKKYGNNVYDLQAYRKEKGA
jgi:ankyrin repeat protein